MQLLKRRARPRRGGPSRVSGGLVVLLALLTRTGSAHAEEGAGAAPLTSAAAASSATAPKVLWRRFRLFDPYLDPRDGGVSVSYLTRREVAGHEADPGIRVGYGETIATHERGLFGRLSVEESLRVTRAGHVVVGLRGYEYGAGAEIGRFSLEGRVGLRVLEVHFGKDGFGGGGFGIGGFTPSSAVSLSLPVGAGRIALSAFSEFAYRWLSSVPAEPIVGVTLGVYGAAIPKGLPDANQAAR